MKIEGDCYAFFEQGSEQEIEVPDECVAIGFARGSKPNLFTVVPGFYLARAMPDRAVPFVILVCPESTRDDFMSVDADVVESIIAQAEMTKLMLDRGVEPREPGNA